MDSAANYRAIEDVDGTASLYQEKEVPEELRDASQRWCLMSVVAAEGTNQRYDKGMAIRLYGCKQGKQAANKWAKELPAKTGNFDVYSVMTNEWYAMPPRIHDASKEERSNEERVDAIMEMHREQEKAKKEALKRQLDRDTRVERRLLPIPDHLEGASAAEIENADRAPPPVRDDAGDEEEPATVPHGLRDGQQAFCVMSVIAPEYGPGVPREVAVRVHGCRPTLEDAESWERQLAENNPFYSVYSLKCCEFASLPPDVATIPKMHSNQPVVQRIHDQYTTEQLARRKAEAERLELEHRVKSE